MCFRAAYSLRPASVRILTAIAFCDVGSFDVGGTGSRGELLGVEAAESSRGVLCFCGPAEI